ncbi:MAG TPA: efflux RND transporter periplasmic adaptor subunit [Candidatus Acidoferrales bacterium]|nr:efflux RND transporter periplasmic adaptor subunit [Candidatus Acidoferrales bacterium]
MRFGPTSLQVSSVLAKGLKKPKLRSDLRISEQTIAGEKSYVIKVAETSSYNRYGESEYELLTLCDGTRTPPEITQALNELHPDEPIAESEVLDFLDGIEPAMWERTVGEKNLAVLERIRDERKSRVDQSSMLYISFRAWDPNKTLEKMDKYLWWIYTPGFVMFSVGIFIVAAYLLAGDWARVQADTASLYTFHNKSAYDIWVFWFLLLGLGGIHELGHGLTCKHFGGDVHQMGFLLIYFTPAFFTDTTDILLFDKIPRRQFVIFAGIWVELVICGIAALVWHFTVAGSITNDVAYKTMLLSGIQGALLNLNPLIKADGYYALSQFLDVDNLREDSFIFLRAWAKKYLFFQDVDLPAASRRLRRIYFIFGMTAITYSTTLLVLVVIFVKNVFVTKFGNWGYVLTLAVIYYFARKGVRKNLPLARAWLRQKREEIMTWKITRKHWIGAGAVVALLLIPPFPSKVSSDFVLEPGRDVRVRAEVPGMIGQVFVHEGDTVQAGQLMATLRNPEIVADAQGVARELALANSNLGVAQERSDLEKVARATTARNQLLEDLSVAQQRAAALEIRAPISGVVTTAQVEQRAGEFLAAGDEFCRVADRSTMKARILVRDWEIEDVRAQAAAELKVAPFPYRTYDGRVEQILPAATLDRPASQPQQLERFGQALTNYIGVVMEFPNPDGSLREGMTGTAKIAGRNRPLAMQMARGAWRWFRSQVW